MSNSRTARNFEIPARRRGGRVARLAVIAAILALAAPADAGGFLDGGDGKNVDEPRPTWAVPAKRMPVEGDGPDAAEAQLANAGMRVREARQNAETAQYEYTRARTRRYPRGDALQEIKDRVDDTLRELDAAESDLLKLLESARAGGVPAGTLSPYMDLAQEIRSDRAARVEP